MVELHSMTISNSMALRNNLLHLLFILISICCIHAQQLPIGWASVDGGTIRGLGGESITVTNRAEFVEAVISRQVPMDY